MSGTIGFDHPGQIIEIGSFFSPRYPTYSNEMTAPVMTYSRDVKYSDEH